MAASISIGKELGLGCRSKLHNIDRASLGVLLGSIGLLRNKQTGLRVFSIAGICFKFTAASGHCTPLSAALQSSPQLHIGKVCCVGYYI